MICIVYVVQEHFFQSLFDLQVASVFQSLTDHTMAPCLVHKESKLFVNRKYPIIIATPDSLFNYGLSSLNNVQVVVTDEADFLITGGGDVVWEILSFFKGVDSLKTKRRQRRLTRRQKVSREPNAVQGSIESFDPNKQNGKKAASATPVCHNELLHAPISAPKRQFVFVAATLPRHGPKAAFNVLKEWIPEARLVSTDLAHHPVPTVGISYMRVHEANKLPMLLLCLNVLAGVFKNPLKNYGMKISIDGEKTVGSNSIILTREELDVPISHQYHPDRNDVSFLECVGLTNLRVLVFANSWKMAEQAFNFLRDVRETDGNDFIVWKLQNDVTTTRCGEKTDCDVHSGTASSFFEKIGDQDIWKGRVGLIHKKLSVNERVENLDKFKSGQLKVLICTDLGSRGLDIPEVTHVIQLDFAPNATAVLHRTGRTARAGSSGKGREKSIVFWSLRGNGGACFWSTYRIFFLKFECFKPKLHQGFLPSVAVVIQHNSDGLHNKHGECNALDTNVSCIVLKSPNTVTCQPSSPFQCKTN